MTEEDTPVLDVHPPHGPVHSWRDFLLHLFTITIGLLIALNLESCVEWRQNKHLVHEAEANLRTEIRSNADGLKDTVADIQAEKKMLNNDIVVLNQIIKTGKAPEHQHMEIQSRIRGFDDLSWKTALTTGAFSFMPYSVAKEYASIYDTQASVFTAQSQAVDESLLSMAPMLDVTDAKQPLSVEQATYVKQRIQIFQARLLLLDSYVDSLDKSYKEFLKAHP